MQITRYTFWLNAQPTYAYVSGVRTPTTKEAAPDENRYCPVNAPKKVSANWRAPITIAATAGVPTIQLPFSTTPNVAAEGFMMSVLPQINEADTVVLNVRPSIRRRVGFATDPNPALAAATPNLIPIFETREMDSILRIQSGQIAMLGGLMQDQVENAEDGIPGVRNIPGIGQLLSQRKDQTRKTELVIFLRATVIRDPSIEGDFRRFSDLLPGSDYFAKPNPQREQPAR